MQLSIILIFIASTVGVIITYPGLVFATHEENNSEDKKSGSDNEVSDTTTTPTDDKKQTDSTTTGNTDQIPLTGIPPTTPPPTVAPSQTCSDGSDHKNDRICAGSEDIITSSTPQIGNPTAGTTVPPTTIPTTTPATITSPTVTNQVEDNSGSGGGGGSSGSEGSSSDEVSSSDEQTTERQNQINDESHYVIANTPDHTIGLYRIIENEDTLTNQAATKIRPIAEFESIGDAIAALMR